MQPPTDAEIEALIANAALDTCEMSPADFYEHLLGYVRLNMPYPVAVQQIEEELQYRPMSFDDFLISDPSADPTIVLRYRMAQSADVANILRRMPEDQQDVWRAYCQKVNYGNVGKGKRSAPRSAEEILRDLNVVPDTAQQIAAKRVIPEMLADLTEETDGLGDFDRAKAYLKKFLERNQDKPWYFFVGPVYHIFKYFDVPQEVLMDFLSYSDHSADDLDLIRLVIKCEIFHDEEDCIPHFVSNLPEDEQPLWQHYVKLAVGDDEPMAEIG